MATVSQLNQLLDVFTQSKSEDDYHKAAENIAKAIIPYEHAYHPPYDPLDAAELEWLAQKLPSNRYQKSVLLQHVNDHIRGIAESKFIEKLASKQSVEFYETPESERPSKLQYVALTAEETAKEMYSGIDMSTYLVTSGEIFFPVISEQGVLTFTTEPVIPRDVLSKCIFGPRNWSTTCTGQPSVKIQDVRVIKTSD